MTDDVVAAAAEGFVVSEDGARWTYCGSLTFDNAAVVCAKSASLPLPASGVVDCGALATVDSSAVAVLLSLKRRATQEGIAVVLDNTPAPLRALATVYGVDDILLAT